MAVCTTTHRKPLFLFQRIFVIYRLLTLILLGSASALAHADEPRIVANNVEIEKLTSTEVRDWIAAGNTIVLIPVGATEQTGRYVVLGKHNFRAQKLANQIALQLGGTLVAPVISYVPEGSIEPPAGHMRYAGTFS